MIADDVAAAAADDDEDNDHHHHHHHGCESKKKTNNGDDDGGVIDDAKARDLLAHLTKNALLYTGRLPNSGFMFHSLGDKSRHCFTENENEQRA
ncbi:hypothetical protein ElyMa_000936500 [Elysia marginata]|uniref:Uncharacterized protein n=1 Tax=Elysia marginata TaxID=1093978 RepID=A0AAV4HC78_9GAST|nr:hypothetical protein ElyMa_000936500 [Elysia marginata]